VEENTKNFRVFATNEKWQNLHEQTASSIDEHIETQSKL